MRIVAIDPGQTIGVAVYDTATKDADAWQTDSVEEASNWIATEYDYYGIDVLIVEDYISAGHLTKSAKHTLKVLGYFEYWLLNYGGVILQVPQKRLSSVEEAAQMCKDANIDGPHSWDALAHALAYARDLA